MIRLPVRVALLAFALAVPLSGHAGSNPDKPRIEGLEASYDPRRVTVSFDMKNCLSDEVEERIHSGIPVSFRHRVDVVSRRGVWMPAKVLARSIVNTSAEYDSVTQQYTLRRTFEIRPRRKRDAVDAIEEERTTRSSDEMRAWMTQLRDLPVYDPTLPMVGDAIRVRVHSEVGRRYLLLIFPATIDLSAELRIEE